MKYLKMLGLAAVAAAALMAFVGVGTASAGEGVLCSTTTNPCTSKWAVNTVLDFSLKSGTSAELTNEENGEVLDTCTGSSTEAGKSTTVKGDLTKNPSTEEKDPAKGEATGINTEILWKTCTFPTNTVENGALKVSRIAGTSNGTVKADAQVRVTINTIFFGSCVYGVKAGADLGVITEGKGTASEFKAEHAPAEKLEGSAIACPPNSTWTATYVLTTPSETTLSVSSS